MVLIELWKEHYASIFSLYKEKNIIIFTYKLTLFISRLFSRCVLYMAMSWWCGCVCVCAPYLLFATRSLPRHHPVRWIEHVCGYIIQGLDAFICHVNGCLQHPLKVMKPNDGKILRGATAAAVHTVLLKPVDRLHHRPVRLQTVMGALFKRRWNVWLMFRCFSRVHHPWNPSVPSPIGTNRRLRRSSAAALNLERHQMFRLSEHLRHTHAHTHTHIFH